ncbi:ThuA domain-containing protein [Rhodococcus sp. Eu-32]|uniref:ThuA domain-containing protein n=1 Tax=Rhodococcus sp. Eu-32 TaxID=1017319 RepID=UPI000DF3321B|nr:ThuA domain-containing protein [Rhodococcus sp. Eu-32]RRQ29868.1 ThuA domain-containing protein [Rhodococcus sp. Eu-32]
MRIAAFTGGHSFDRDAFASLLESLPGDVTWFEHPDVDLGPTELTTFDVCLHYDMPGTLPEPSDPPAALRDAIASAPTTGLGYVVLHHAIASWATWEGWSEFVGGKYLYRPGVVRGIDEPDSGYRLDVPQRISVADASHPVVEGIPPTFDIVDETYLCQVFEDDVTPLLRSDAEMTDAVHWSTALAMAGRRGEREGWHHEPGSSLCGWTKTNGRSRLVYLQPGDSAATLGDPVYRRLVAGAVHWAARPQGFM